MSTVASASDVEVFVKSPVKSASRRWTSGPAIVLYLAAFKLLLHLLVAGRYGYMEDELYFIACGDHLDWGYVDAPPLTAFIAKAERVLTGDSLLSLRLLPAIAGAALVWMTGAITRTLGGGRFAQALAAIGIITVPLYLSLHYVLTMNAFEPLFWTGLAYMVLLAVKRDNPRLLIWFGVIVGFGLLNKYSMAIFASALCIGLLSTPHRKFLASKWLWMGIGIGFLIFAPHLNWLIRHHFSFLELQHNIKSFPGVLAPKATDFILQQFFVTGTASLLWVAGLVFYFGTSKGKPYRFLGWAFVLTMVFFIATKGKNYYPLPTYAIAIAGGALVLERATCKGVRERFRGPLLTVILAGAALLAPMYLPILPIDSLARYQFAIGMYPPRQERFMMGSTISSFFVLQFGWQSLAAKVGNVYRNLPEDDRQRAVIFGRTTGDAAAVDFFGKRYGLPKAISGHLGYFDWGPGNNRSDVVIFVGYNVADIAPICKELEIVDRMYAPYAYPNEMNKPIMVCRGLSVDLQTQWSRFKLWY